MAKRTIGLHGPAGVGKSTIAKAIQENTNTKCTVISLAAPMKLALGAMLEYAGLPEDYMHDPLLKEAGLAAFGGKSARYLLQRLGEEYGRQMVSPDLWINLALERSLRTPGTVLIDDVRYMNEAEAIWKSGGDVFMLTCEGINFTRDHPSAMPIEDDRIIQVANDLSPRDVAGAIWGMIK